MSTVKNLPVTLDDQKRINRYSYLVYHRNRLAAMLEELKGAAENQKEAAEELDALELEDELPEYIQVRLGAAFFHLPASQARREAELELSTRIEEHARFSKVLESCKMEMNELKSALETKFGDAIRLE